jgi:hypothetical protein
VSYSAMPYLEIKHHKSSRSCRSRLAGLEVPVAAPCCFIKTMRPAYYSAEF